MIGSRLFVSPGTVNLVNIGNDQITSIGSINGVTGYLGGDCTFDKNNNRYFINTSEGIKVINATNGSIISTIPNQEPNGFLITSIEYNPNNDRLIGVYASGNPDIIKSVNISTGIISNLSTIPDFGNYNSGDCTFDVANNRYFINTSSGIKVINGSNGSLISTINDQDMVRCV